MKQKQIKYDVLCSSMYVLRSCECEAMQLTGERNQPTCLAAISRCECAERRRHAADEGVADACVAAVLVGSQSSTAEPSQ